MATRRDRSPAGRGPPSSCRPRSRPAARWAPCSTDRTPAARISSVPASIHAAMSRATPAEIRDRWISHSRRTSVTNRRRVGSSRASHRSRWIGRSESRPCRQPSGLARMRERASAIGSGHAASSAAVNRGVDGRGRQGSSWDRGSSPCRDTATTRPAPRPRITDAARSIAVCPVPTIEHGLAGHHGLERRRRPRVAHEPRVAAGRDVAQERRDRGQLVAGRDHDRVGRERPAAREGDADRGAGRTRGVDRGDPRADVLERHGRAGARLVEQRAEVAPVRRPVREPVLRHAGPAREVVRVVDEAAHRHGRDVEPVPRVGRPERDAPSEVRARLDDGHGQPRAAAPEQLDRGQRARRAAAHDHDGPRVTHRGEASRSPGRPCRPRMIGACSSRSTSGTRTSPSASSRAARSSPSGGRPRPARARPTSSRCCCATCSPSTTTRSTASRRWPSPRSCPRRPRRWSRSRRAAGHPRPARVVGHRADRDPRGPPGPGGAGPDRQRARRRAAPRRAGGRRRLRHRHDPRLRRRGRRVRRRGDRPRARARARRAGRPHGEAAAGRAARPGPGDRARHRRRDPGRDGDRVPGARRGPRRAGDGRAGRGRWRRPGPTST